METAGRLASLLTSAISGSGWTIAGQTRFTLRPFGWPKDAPSAAQRSFGSVGELSRSLSRSMQLDRRAEWYDARSVAGDRAVGHDAIEVIRQWVHQPILSQGEWAVEATLAGKLIHRLEPQADQDAVDLTAQLSVRPLADCLGGRRDIEAVLRHLCLRHGWQDTTLQNPQSLTRARRLARAHHLNAKTAAELVAEEAKLQAMEDHLDVFLPAAGGVWGNATAAQQARLAARLGIRAGGQTRTQRDGPAGPGGGPKAILTRPVVATRPDCKTGSWQRCKPIGTSSLRRRAVAPRRHPSERIWSCSGSSWIPKRTSSDGSRRLPTPDCPAAARLPKISSSYPGRPTVTYRRSAACTTSRPPPRPSPRRWPRRAIRA